jgi:phage gp36-like protein
MRFIKETDYLGRIKPEIKLMLTGTTDGSSPSMTQIRAEDTAISTIIEYIGGRYDCSLIFQPSTGDTDSRNLHIVKCVIILALFDLYHQSGMKDIPETRKVEYDDTIMWLKDIGRGDIKSTLPPLTDTTDPGDIRFNSRPPRNFKY